MEILRAITSETPHNHETQHFTFAELADRHSGPVYKFCRSLTYSKEDAEDLFQETFLAAFEQLPKLNDSENPAGFLFSTALFIWKSWKRKYARRDRLAPAQPLDDDVADENSIEESYIEREEIRAVRKAVNELPEKFKIPIILYYTMELDIAHIAAALKLPAGTVKSRLHKARKLIERGLADLL